MEIQMIDELWNSLSFNDKVITAISSQKNKVGYFYVAMLTFGNIVEDETIETACVEYNTRTKTIKIRINPKFPKNFEQLTYLIMHEFFHLFLGHSSGHRSTIEKYNKKSRKLTNIILDCQINTILDSFSPFRTGTITAEMNGYNFTRLEKIVKEKYPNKNWIYSSTNLYQSIEDWLEELSFLYEQEQGVDGNELDHSHLDGIGNDEEDLEQIESSLQQILSECKDKAVEQKLKSIGGAEDLFAVIFSGLYKPKRRFMIPTLMGGLREISKLSDYGTYTLPNIFQSAYSYPKKRILPQKSGKIVVGFDISGSVSEEEKIVILKKISQIQNDIDLIFWSCEDTIQQRNVYKSFNYKKMGKLKPQSEGGTDLKGLFKYVTKEYEGEKITLVILSDFYVNPLELPDNVCSLHLYKTVAENSQMEFLINKWKEKTKKIKTYQLVTEY